MSGKITEEFINWQCVEATASETAGEKSTISPIICPFQPRRRLSIYVLFFYVLELEVKVRTVKCSQYSCS